MKHPYHKVFLAVFLIPLFAVSCTHQGEQYSFVDETVSVRYAVKKAAGAVSWTDPIEPEALDAKPAGEVKNVQFYPAAGFVLLENKQSVYPTLEDFGSLDTSDMNRNVLLGLNDFLKQLSHKNLTFKSAYFDKPYEGVVILYEASHLPAIKGWTVGKPFIVDGESAAYEVPVLLSTEDGTCTARIYLDPEKAALSEVKIQQVMFGMVKSE